MDINDLDISSDNNDMIATVGKDCKVTVWLLSRYGFIYILIVFYLVY
jgi:hypothetical protein